MSNILELRQIIDLAKQDRIVYRSASELKKHPLNEFPDIAGQKWETFKQGIKAIGVLHPVLLDVNGRVLSGWQRTRACAELGMEVPTYQLREAISQDTARKIIILLNLNREFTREEFAKYWEEVYADWVREQVRSGVPASQISRQISAESGINRNTSLRNVQRVQNEEIKKKYGTIDKLPIVDSAKKRLKSLIDKGKAELKEIDAGVERYRAIRSEISKIIDPSIQGLPEITAQKRNDKKTSITDLPEVSVNKYQGTSPKKAQPPKKPQKLLRRVGAR